MRSNIFTYLFLLCISFITVSAGSFQFQGGLDEDELLVRHHIDDLLVIRNTRGTSESSKKFIPPALGQKPLPLPPYPEEPYRERIALSPGRPADVKVVEDCEKHRSGCEIVDGRIKIPSQRKYEGRSLDDQDFRLFYARTMDEDDFEDYDY